MDNSEEITSLHSVMEGQYREIGRELRELARTAEDLGVELDSNALNVTCNFDSTLNASSNSVECVSLENPPMEKSSHRGVESEVSTSAIVSNVNYNLNPSEVPSSTSSTSAEARPSLEEVVSRADASFVEWYRGRIRGAWLIV